MSRGSYFLLAVKMPSDSMDIIKDSMAELEGLVMTAGGTVVGTLIQQRRMIDPVYYVGRGKLEEVDFLFDRTEKGEFALVVNAALSPTQARNIEEVLECRVITRTELILDIFALRAQSQIAKLQVETAQLSYLLPRLTGQGSSMSRTGGGIGTRGPGETKLETDRRKINRRIDLLKKELKYLDKSSKERRKNRESVFKVAIAGYTNAGKSSLTSLLVGENLLSENKLFSTIDTSTRRLRLDGIPAVMTDTVGFIRDIPHELVESFKSTFAETAYSDIILHAVDVSSPFYKEKIQTAYDLLEDIEAEKNLVLVFNKIDLISIEQLLEVKSEYPDAFYLSAKNQEGIVALKNFLKNKALAFYEENGGLPDFLKWYNPTNLS